MNPGECTKLWAYLENVPDPRDAKGKRYEWVSLLVILCAGLLAGQKTVEAISDWAKEHGEELIGGLGLKRKRMPHLSTLRRALRRVGVEALEEKLAAYREALAQASGESDGLRGADGSLLVGEALDGKALRGANKHGAKVHLLSRVRHSSQLVVNQRQVEAKTNEIGELPTLLAGHDLTGCVETMDALLCQTEIAQQILDQNGDYLMGVKDNQHQLYASLDLLFRCPPQPAYPGEVHTVTTYDKGHGRSETRSLTTSTALQDYLLWPGARQVLKRTCRRKIRKTGQVSEEVTYAITSLPPQKAGPKQLAALWRGHWTIENPIHYVRDETFAEDRCQIHTGTAPHALAALRNAVLNLLHFQGWHRIAHALRHYMASLPKLLSLSGVPAS